MRGRFVLALGLAFASGCSKPAPPTLTPERATVTQVSPVGFVLSVDLSATNPNSSDLSAQGMTARVVLDKQVDLGSVTAAQPFTLPAGKTTSMTVPLSVPWSNLPALVQLGLANRDVPYAVDGTVSMGGALVNVGVPFHLEGVMTHDQLVSVTMRSLPGFAP